MSFPRKQESSIQHIWGSEAIEARADGMMPAADEKAARALLDWYRAMGVDEAIGEAPVDCFAAAADFKPAPRPAPEPRRAAPPPRAAPRAASASSTRGIGAEVSTLAELQELVARFDGGGKAVDRHLADRLVDAHGPIPIEQGPRRLFVRCRHHLARTCLNCLASPDVLDTGFQSMRE